MDAKNSEYHKIFLGKTILWPWPLSTFDENLNECQDCPFSGSIVSPRKALDRPFKLQRCGVTACPFLHPLISDLNHR